MKLCVRHFKNREIVGFGMSILVRAFNSTLCNDANKCIFINSAERMCEYITSAVNQTHTYFFSPIII